MSFKTSFFSCLSWSRWSLNKYTEFAGVLLKGMTIGAFAIFFAACDDDSGSSVGPENEVELAESSSSQTVILSSDSHEYSSGGSFNGWSWDVPKKFRLNSEITYGSMVDSRDGKTYKTVTIGSQTWMAENLNYADSATTESLIDESWCYNDVATNCDVAGRLYSWRAAVDYKKTGCGSGPICLTTLPVRGICPEGWHLPDSTEWNTLFTAVGGASTAGIMLKSRSGWNDYEGKNGNGTDAYGFSALPAGDRYSNGFCTNEGRNAIFWSASEMDHSNAYYMYLYNDHDYGALDSYFKSKGYSVRCVKN